MVSPPSTTHTYANTHTKTASINFHLWLSVHSRSRLFVVSHSFKETYGNPPTY